MLSKEQNEFLTRVGPGTPGGELLRRYWWPVGISSHVKDKPTYIRLLAEDLVLFRDGKGKLGLLGAKCSHRRANLCFGTVEPDGLRCRYHGWKYAADGMVLEIPGEPAQTGLRERIRHTSYRIEESAGLIFAYLGPEPVPLLPQYDIFAAEGERRVKINGFSNCNWLQCVENGMDPMHVSFSHFDVLTDLVEGPTAVKCARTEYGMVHKTLREGPQRGSYIYREHHLCMPGIAVTGSGQRYLGKASGTPAVGGRWSIPIDDTKTMMINTFFKPADNTAELVRTPTRGRWEAVVAEPYKEYKDDENPTVGYQLPAFIPVEDASLLDSMGPISDRENENLTVNDESIVMLRELYMKAVTTVEAGGDPPGVFRRRNVVHVPAYEKLISESERVALEI